MLTIVIVIVILKTKLELKSNLLHYRYIMLPFYKHWFEFLNTHKTATAATEWISLQRLVAVTVARSVLDVRYAKP